MKKIVATSLLVLSASAFAQGAGPSIDGEVKMKIEALQNLNAAVGNESSASQAIGAIESGNIKGGIDMVISAEQNLNAAVGNKACSDQQIGTIGKGSSCK